MGIVLSIILVLILCSVCFIIYRKNTRIQRLGTAIEKAIDKFNSLCFVSKVFTQEELEKYKEEYSDLYETISKLNSSMTLLSSVRVKYKLPDFIRIYEYLESFQKANNTIAYALIEIDKHLPEASAAALTAFSESKYLNNSKFEYYLKFSDVILENSDKIKGYEQYLAHGKMYSKLMDLLSRKEQYKQNFNESFINKELEKHKKFFDTALEYKLDPQQRNAIVKEEDNCLVISSAGGGKTSTIVGKVKYLTECKHVDADKILLITYTRKASQELSSRLGLDRLHCVTFHKLAIDIITKYTGIKPSLCEIGFLKIIYQKHLNNPDFKSAINTYITRYRSLMRTEHMYDNSVEYFSDRKKYGIQALYPDCNNNVIYTKSEEEKRICHYLSELGVQFCYEAPYEYQLATPEYRQYRPDFTIYYTNKSGKQTHIYLEHFGINEKGNVPKWFGKDGSYRSWELANIKYNQGIAWKRNTHHKYGTYLIETTSADFHSNTIESKLKKQLTDCGVPLNPLSEDEKFSRLIQRDDRNVENVYTLVESFISLAKCNGIKLDDLIDNAKKNNNTRSLFIIENIISPIYRDYHSEMKANGLIDFTDAIYMATELLKKFRTKYYSHILIDEFQDISYDRYQFLLELRKSDSPWGVAKIFSVGDDWQSIYRFSGSDISLFYDFQKYFGYTEECRIESTYRFGNPAIEKSSQFILKNPEQKQKNIVAGNPKFSSTNINFIETNDRTDTIYKLYHLIITIPQDESIYIIGRYTYDIKTIDPSVNINSNDIYVNIGNRKIKYMTVHSSKGLEADHIILINCNQGVHGFPSMIADDPILDYVLSKNDHFENAEERRVFYVAITRAKKNTYVLYDKNFPSPFVLEMNPRIDTKDEKLCPICKDGHIFAARSGIAKNGVHFTIYRCNNHNANCPYFERVFYMENGEPLNSKDDSATRHRRQFLIDDN